MEKSRRHLLNQLDILSITNSGANGHSTSPDWIPERSHQAFLAKMFNLSITKQSYKHKLRNNPQNS